MGTVLLLDRDRRSCRETYSLIGARFAVVACHAVFRAFQYLRLHKTDLVVVKTSGKDAFATAILSWCRQEGVRIPTIVLVDHGASHDVNLIRQLGARRVFRCPQSRGKLLAAVTAELRGAEQVGADSMDERMQFSQTSDAPKRTSRSQIRNVA